MEGVQEALGPSCNGNLVLGTSIPSQASSCHGQSQLGEGQPVSGASEAETWPLPSVSYVVNSLCELGQVTDCLGLIFFHIL